MKRLKFLALIALKLALTQAYFLDSQPFIRCTTDTKRMQEIIKEGPSMEDVTQNDCSITIEDGDREQERTNITCMLIENGPPYYQRNLETLEVKIYNRAGNSKTTRLNNRMGEMVDLNYKEGGTDWTIPVDSVVTIFRNSYDYTALMLPDTFRADPGQAYYKVIRRERTQFFSTNQMPTDQVLCEGKVWKKSWDEPISKAINTRSDGDIDMKSTYYTGDGIFFHVGDQYSTSKIIFSNPHSSGNPSVSMLDIGATATTGTNATKYAIIPNNLNPATFQPIEVDLVNYVHFEPYTLKTTYTKYLLVLDSTKLLRVDVSLGQPAVVLLEATGLTGFAKLNRDDSDFFAKVQTDGPVRYVHSLGEAKLYGVYPALHVVKTYSIPRQSNHSIIGVAVSLLEEICTVTTAKPNGDILTHIYKIDPKTVQLTQKYPGAAFLEASPEYTVTDSRYLSAHTLIRLNSDGSMHVSHDKGLLFANVAKSATAVMPWSRIIETSDESSLYLVDSNNQTFYWRDGIPRVLSTGFEFPDTCANVVLEVKAFSQSSMKLFCRGADEREKYSWQYVSGNDKLTTQSIMADSGVAPCNVKQLAFFYNKDHQQYEEKTEFSFSQKHPTLLIGYLTSVAKRKKPFYRVSDSEKAVVASEAYRDDTNKFLTGASSILIKISSPKRHYTSDYTGKLISIELGVLGGSPWCPKTRLRGRIENPWRLVYVEPETHTLYNMTQRISMLSDQIAKDQYAAHNQLHVLSTNYRAPSKYGKNQHLSRCDNQTDPRCVTRVYNGLGNPVFENPWMESFLINDATAALDLVKNRSLTKSCHNFNANGKCLATEGSGSEKRLLCTPGMQTSSRADGEFDFSECRKMVSLNPLRPEGGRCTKLPLMFRDELTGKLYNITDDYAVYITEVNKREANLEYNFNHYHCLYNKFLKQGDSFWSKYLPTQWLLPNAWLANTTGINIFSKDSILGDFLLKIWSDNTYCTYYPQKSWFQSHAEAHPNLRNDTNLITRFKSAMDNHEEFSEDNLFVANDIRVQIMAGGLFHFRLRMLNINDPEEPLQSSFFMFYDDRQSEENALIVQGFVHIIFVLCLYLPFKRYVDEYGNGSLFDAISMINADSSTSLEADMHGLDLTMKHEYRKSIQMTCDKAHDMPSAKQRRKTRAYSRGLLLAESIDADDSD